MADSWPDSWSRSYPTGLSFRPSVAKILKELKLIKAARGPQFSNEIADIDFTGDLDELEIKF